MSLQKALRVFYSRLAKIPFDRGARLRHWKGIVEEIHIDFVARVPEAKHPLLATRASLMVTVPEEYTCVEKHWDRVLLAQGGSV